MLPQFKENQTYSIKVKANASKNDIAMVNDVVTVFTTAQAVDSKANKSIVTLFKKLLKVRIEITKGLKSKDKIIKIIKGSKE